MILLFYNIVKLALLTDPPLRHGGKQYELAAEYRPGFGRSDKLIRPYYCSGTTVNNASSPSPVFTILWDDPFGQ